MRVITLLIILFTAELCFASLTSTSGKIDFFLNDSSSTSMSLSENGLVIGSQVNSSSNLYVGGNALISTSLTVGSESTSTSANLSIMGSLSFSVESVNGNVTLQDHSHVLADSSSGNLYLELPDPAATDGRIIVLKKTSTLNEVTISSNTLIDNSSSYLLTSSNTGYIRLASTGSSWVALSTSEAKPWEPSELSQIIGWYDASDASTITEAGGFVSAWQDKSGLDNHLTQSDANAQPQTETESINQLNAIDFDHTGTYDALETSNNPFGANISDAMIIFTATATDTSLKTQFSLSGNADAASRWQTHINRPSGETLFDVGGTNEGVGTRLTVPTDYSTGDNILMAFYVSTTESKQEVYSAGNLLSPTSTGRAVSTAGNILIGSTSNEGSSINYGEVIILNGTVSSDERQLLEGYLANKWGLKSLFQEDHPFNLI